VAGRDIRTDILGVRNSLGLCPQHNVLFDDLTVAEHIYFFGSLKGLSGERLNEEIEKYVKALGLEDKVIIDTGKTHQNSFLYCNIIQFSEKCQI
jgi:ATP-binding cassette, subfamily A (ABC1), member 3